MSMRSGAEATEALRDQRSHGYETPRPDVQALVPRGSRRILELGCSNGALGAALKARDGAYVLGIEIDAQYAAIAEERLDRVVVGDAESALAAGFEDEAPFDCLIGADVFEHLVDPWTTLERAVALLRPGATVVVSLPNVLHWQLLGRVVLERRWPREASGPFDQTHLRWFSRSDGVELLTGAGATVQQVVPSYWTEGWRLRLVETLARTPLRDYLAQQQLFVGVTPSPGQSAP